MVVLHVKRGDADEWLFECASADACDAVIQQLVSGPRRRRG
jgi:hypothetical protein